MYGAAFLFVKRNEDRPAWAHALPCVLVPAPRPEPCRPARSVPLCAVVSVALDGIAHGLHFLQPYVITIALFFSSINRLLLPSS